MANKFAIANGNWNSGAIWNDGFVPTSSDNVWCNSFNVTLNTDIDVNSLRSDISPIILPNNPIPLMTSNTSPSGVANAGTNATAAWNVFDQDSLTSWTSSAGLGTTAWVSYQLTSGIVAKKYYILRPAATTNRPSGWVFQGSNDGSSWTTLHTVAGDATASSYTSGTLANATSYTYYRILVNTVAGGTNAQIFSFEITNDTTSVLGGQNGGSFIVTGNRDITCSEPGENGIVAGSTTCLNINSTNSTININANVRGSLTTSAINTIDFNSVSSSGNTINVVGDLNGYATSRISLVCRAPNTTVNVTGSVNSQGGFAISILSTATNTNLYIDRSINTTVSNVITHQSTGSITVDGDLIASNGYCINRTAGADITINGNIYGASSVTTGYGISVTTTSGGQIAINGDIYGSNSPGILLNGASTLMIINGSIYAGANSPGVSCTVNTNIPLRVSGNLINTTTTIAAWHPAIQLIGTGQYWEFTDASGNDKTLYSPGVDLGNPAATDVRDGVSYASGALTGTLKVPSPSSVAVGVPVDNAVGTAIIDISDMGALLASYVV